MYVRTGEERGVARGEGDPLFTSHIVEGFDSARHLPTNTVGYLNILYPVMPCVWRSW